jgi:hypothetical protein
MFKNKTKTTRLFHKRKNELENKIKRKQRGLFFLRVMKITCNSETGNILNLRITEIWHIL